MNKIKSDLRSEIKALRFQVANLETRCKEREDKLIEFVLLLEPFLNALSPEVHKQVMKVLEDD